MGYGITERFKGIRYHYQSQEYRIFHQKTIPKGMANAIVLGINPVRLLNYIPPGERGYITKCPFLPRPRYTVRNRR